MPRTYSRLGATLLLVLCGCMVVKVAFATLGVFMRQGDGLLSLTALVGLAAGGATTLRRAPARQSAVAPAHWRWWPQAAFLTLGYFGVASTSPDGLGTLGVQWPMALATGHYPAAASLGAVLACLMAATAFRIGYTLTSGDLDRTLKLVFRVGVAIFSVSLLLEAAVDLEFPANRLLPWFAITALSALALSRIPANRVFVPAWTLTVLAYLTALLGVSAALATGVSAKTPVDGSMLLAVWQDAGSAVVSGISEFTAWVSATLSGDDSARAANAPPLGGQIPSGSGASGVIKAATIDLGEALLRLPAIAAFAWLAYQLLTAPPSPNPPPVEPPPVEPPPQETRTDTKVALGQASGPSAWWAMLRTLVTGHAQPLGAEQANRARQPFGIPVVALYHRLLALAQHRGHVVIASQTPNERVTPLQRVVPEVAVHAVTDSFNAALYGSKPVADEQVAAWQEHVERGIKAPPK